MLFRAEVFLIGLNYTAIRTYPFYREFSSEKKESSGYGDRGVILCNASSVRPAPAFGLQYARNYYNLLAVADEEGYISVINTSKELPQSLDDEPGSSLRPVAHWLAHRNAIFDATWCNQDTWMYTASGDMTLSLWDTGYATKLASLCGHTGSVKCIAVSPTCPEVIVSGGRDGMLMLWDIRKGDKSMSNIQRSSIHTSTGGSTSIKPVFRLYHPHERGPTSKRRKQALQGRVAPSVTAVSFLSSTSQHLVVSGGVDGKIKFWDVRYPATNLTTGCALPEALDYSANAPCPLLGMRHYAVTSIALRPGTSQILTSFTGGHHVLYDACRPHCGPVCWYGGHTVNSFYVKAAWNSDGSHFASGSSDSQVYIWQAEGSPQDAYVLSGHEKEVTTVAWCPTDPLQLASAADDCTLRVWKVDRVQKEEEADPPRRWEGPYKSASPRGCPSLSPRLALTQEHVAPSPLSVPRPSGGEGSVRRLRISKSLMDGTFLKTRSSCKRRRQQTLMESLRGTRPGRQTTQGAKDLSESDGKQQLVGVQTSCGSHENCPGNFQDRAQ